tara:strand:+ start:1068 stop:1400 length:333 start_codon:yes stop_codon:yes gene_type:complete
MRYTKTKIFVNDEEYYQYLFEKRGIKIATHYETPKLRNPTIAERTSLLTDSHIWSYGDRLSNLAYKYYGNVTYWWVIAWYNGVAMEAEIVNGDLLEIPVNLRKTLEVLGV